MRPWTPIKNCEPEREGWYEVTHGLSSLHCTVREVTIAAFDPTNDGLKRWQRADFRPVLYVVAWRDIPAPWWGDEIPEPLTFNEADYSQWVPLEWWNHIKALIVNRVARHKELGKVLDISLRGKRPPPSVERTIGKAVEATLVKLLDEMIELETKC